MSSTLQPGGPADVPPASKNDSCELYQDYARTHYATMYAFDDREFRRMARKYRWQYRGLLPDNKDAAIVDVGCGAGHFLAMLEGCGYGNCTGVDASADQVEICRAKVKARVHLEDAESYLAAHSACADWIVSMHVIEHLPLPAAQRFLGGLYALLKPGGILVLATPNADSPWAGHCRYADLTHRHLYTVGTLRELASKAGFCFVQARPETAAPYDVLTLIRWVLASMLHLMRKIIFSIEVGPGRAKRHELILTPGIIAVFSKPAETADAPPASCRARKADHPSAHPDRPL